jgi:hypothetical protein
MIGFSAYPEEILRSLVAALPLFLMRELFGVLSLSLVGAKAS